MTQFEDFDRDELAADSQRLAQLSTDNVELISAYLDGELSPAEKAEVQSWIDLDPELKAVYTSMLTLQSQMQNLKAPASTRSVEEITNNVFQSLDRRRRRIWLWGSAIAASAIAGITGITGIGGRMQVARTPNLRGNQADLVMLAVALNKPAVNIPKSANSYDTQP